jgi:malonyl-CoA O-methyltransferase
MSSQQLKIAALNRAAAHYDQHAPWQQEITNRLLEHLDPIRLTPKTILDIGMRTGYSTHLLHQRYPKANIVAIDWAEKMLQQAAQRSRWWWQWCPSLVTASCEQLPLANNSVDLVFANMALAECQNIELGLKEIRRVLRPEGLFLFSVLGPSSLQELRQSWAEVDPYHSHVEEFIDMHDWGDRLMQVGLIDPVMDMEQLTLMYDDRNILFADLRGTGNQNLSPMRQRCLTGKQRFQQFLQAYERFRQADEGWPTTLEIVYGHAWGARVASTGGLDEKGEARIPLHAIKILR